MLLNFSLGWRVGPILSALIFVGCDGGNEAPHGEPDLASEVVELPQVALLSGEELIEQYCVACHLSPEPQDLPAARWPFVLEWMGNYVGMENPKTFKWDYLLLSGLIPSEPAMSVEEWSAIKDYLTQNGGKESEPARLLDDPQFEEEEFSPYGPGFGGMITALHLDSHQVLHAAEGLDQIVYRFDLKGELLGTAGPLSSEVVGAVQANGSLFYTLIGHLHTPGNEGMVMLFSEGWKRQMVGPFPRLARVRAVDVDGDGEEELLLSAFGDDLEGALILVSLGSDGEIEKSEELLSMRGCVEARGIDLGNDGDQDILALFAQGRQELWMLENDGTGEFTPRMVFKKRPSWGFTGFELADLDADGHADLIAYAGNNLEHPDPPARPYHGLHFFKGDGRGGFEEKPEAFIHMPGVVVVRTGDWDLDGRVDLVAGAVIEDWRTDDAVGAMVIKNLGGFQFESRLLSHAPTLTIEPADVDGDGDLDLFLGLYSNVVFPEMPAEEADRAVLVTQETPSLRWFRNKKNQ